MTHTPNPDKSRRIQEKPDDCGFVCRLLLSTVLLAIALGCNGEEATGEAGGTPGELGAESSSLARVVGQVPAASDGFASVVILRALDDSGSSGAASRKRFMGQYGTAFTPTVVAARVGEAVQFSNDEEQLHNVHATDTQSEKTVFNVTTMYGGPGYAHVFERPGLYRINCNIHGAMLAYIMVAEAAVAVVADSEGRFSMEDVAPGSYELEVWNVDQAKRRQRSIEVTSPLTEIALDSS